MDSVKKEISEQTGPADTRVIGRLDLIASRLDIQEERLDGLEESERRKDEKLDKLIALMEVCAVGGRSAQSQTSTDPTLEQKLDAMKSDIQGLKQIGDKVDEKLEKFETRSKKKIDLIVRKRKLLHYKV